MIKPIVLLVVICSGLFAEPTVAQGKRLAVYQFRSENLEAMGSETELMLASRSVLSGLGPFDLISVREISDRLGRAGISQSVSVDSAVEGGRALNANYVLTGSMIKEGVEYRLAINLIDIAKADSVGSWLLFGNTTSELISEFKKAAPALVDIMLPEVVEPSLDEMLGEDEAASEFYVPTFEARDADWALVWEPDPEEEVLGYNIYRAPKVDGEFLYLSSVTDSEYIYTPSGNADRSAFKISIVGDDGEEREVDTVVELPEKETVVFGDNADAPAIIRVKRSVGGISFTCVPSLGAENRDAGCYVYRAVDDDKHTLLAKADADEKGLTSSFTDEDLPRRAEYVSYAVSHIRSANLPSVSSAPVKLDIVKGPAIIEARVDKSRQVALAWDMPDDIDVAGVRVYRRFSGTSWRQIAELDDIDEGTYVDDDFDEDGVPVAYRLTLFDDQGESGPSQTERVITKKSLDGPVISQVSTNLTRAIKIKWEPSTDPLASGYVIMRALRNPGDTNWVLKEVARLDDVDADQYLDEGSDELALLDDQEYVYGIATLNDVGAHGEVGPIATGRTAADADVTAEGDFLDHDANDDRFRDDSAEEDGARR